jgi:hypothetical protein
LIINRFKVLEDRWGTLPGRPIFDQLMALPSAEKMVYFSV